MAVQSRVESSQAEYSRVKQNVHLDNYLLQSSFHSLNRSPLHHSINQTTISPPCDAALSMHLLLRLPFLITSYWQLIAIADWISHTP